MSALKHLCLAGLLLAPLRPCAAGPLTWEQCVQAAREQHPGLVAARQNIQAAEAAIRAARSPGLPQASASASAAVSDDSASAGQEESYRATLDVEQRLYDGGSTRSSVRIAEADRAAALAEALQVEADILYALRVAYADLLHAQAQIGLLEQIRNRRADNVEMVELRYLGGQEHQGSLALNQASLQEAETELVQARRSLGTAQSVLARAMGYATDQPGLAVTGRYEDVQVPDDVDRSVLARTTPSYIRAQASYERARQQVELARSGRRPNLSAYGAASRYGDEPDVAEDSLSAGVRLTLPLWEGGQTGAEIRRAAAQQAAAEASLLDTLNTERTNLEQTWQAYRDAGETVAVQQTYLAAQDLRAAIAREQYGNGLLKFDNWDIIENDLISRHKSLLESRRQAFRAEAAWWRALGRGLGGAAGEMP